MVRYRVAHDFTVVHVQYWRQVALVPFADVLLKFLPHDHADGLVVDSEAFVLELRTDSTVAVAAPVLCMYRPCPFAFFRVAVGPLAQVVVVCGAEQTASLQEMFERVLAAQFSDDLGPIPNISAFSSWSRTFFFR